MIDKAKFEKLLELKKEIDNSKNELSTKWTILNGFAKDLISIISTSYDHNNVRLTEEGQIEAEKFEDETPIQFYNRVEDSLDHILDNIYTDFINEIKEWKNFSD